MAQNAENSTTNNSDAEKKKMDVYMQTITQEYDSLKLQYAQLSERYKRLAEYNGNVRQTEAALNEEKARAQQIMTAAVSEADRIVKNAYNELWYINNEKRRLVAELTDLVNWLSRTI